MVHQHLCKVNLCITFPSASLSPPEDSRQFPGSRGDVLALKPMRSSAAQRQELTHSSDTQHWARPLSQHASPT